MGWAIWACLLLLQQASATLVSRARNSDSLKFHAMAAIGSNGIWFLSQVIIVKKITDAFKTGDWTLIAITAIFYCVFCVTGSVSMHYLSMKYFEKGKNVGSIKI